MFRAHKLDCSRRRQPLNHFEPPPKKLLHDLWVTTDLGRQRYYVNDASSATEIRISTTITNYK
jgi:hypothetical protein